MSQDVPDLSLTEWTVLAVLAEKPSHGFALARELRADGELGRVWTIPRPLVYRALDQLLGHRLVVVVGEEASGAGPVRTVHRVTPRGRRAVRAWLSEPVEHLREVRSILLLKVLLLQRSGLDRRPLLLAQREILAPVVEGLAARLEEVGDDDAVLAWRYESSQAAARFLDRLLGEADPPRTSGGGAAPGPARPLGALR